MDNYTPVDQLVMTIYMPSGIQSFHCIFAMKNDLSLSESLPNIVDLPQ